MKKCLTKNNKSFDLLSDDNKRFSVKTITDENKNGRTTPIKSDWDYLIIIYLKKEEHNAYEVNTIGFIDKKTFKKSLKKYKKIKSETPTASLTMLKESGIIGMNPECVFKGKGVKHLI